MDKVSESPTISTIQVETVPTLSQTSTFSGVVEGESDTDEGPEYDEDFYEQLGEIELERSDSGEESDLHDGDIEDELREVELEESSSQATELQDVSYFSSDSDEKIVEKFSRNLKSFKLDEELDLKALDNSVDLTNKFDINESQGSSRKDYLEIVGEPSLMDDDDIEQGLEEFSEIERTRYREVDTSGLQEQKNKDSKNEQLVRQELLQEEQIHREQKRVSKQLHQRQEREQQLLKEQRVREENLNEKKLKENEQRLKHEEEPHGEVEELEKEQLRQKHKQESQNLLRREQLQREEQSREKERQGQNLILQQQHAASLLQSQPENLSSPQAQKPIHEDILKSGTRSQNEPITPATPSLSMKSFHLPDISLSQQSDAREFRRMSNIFGNSSKGPVAALRTLTDNYRRLELDKQSADVKINQLERQLEQYHQLLQKEPVENGVTRNSQEKFPLSEKEKTDPSVVSLQNKYKAMKRQLTYMKTYARKAEDERDEAKKALVKTQQDIAQMNDQFESLKASVQMPNKRTHSSNLAIPTHPISSTSLELPAKFPLSEKAIKPSDIGRSEDNINDLEPKENIRDSGSEKSKSRERVDQEQIRKIQEEIENSRMIRENLRKQRQAMEKAHRKKAALESERTLGEDNGSVEGSEDGQPTKFRIPQQYIFNHKEQLYNEETCSSSSKVPNRRTANQTQFSGDYREQQYYNEHYQDNPQFTNNKRPSKSSNFTGQIGEQIIDKNISPEKNLNGDMIAFNKNKYIDPRDQDRDNHFMRDNRQYFDTGRDESFSEQEDSGQFPHLFGRRRKFFDDEKEDSDIHSNELRQSLARDGRVYSRYSDESQDNVYTHIKDRKRCFHHEYDDSEEGNDHIEDHEYRELNNGKQSTNLQRDYPIWKDIKNSKSYLRKRNYNLQEPVSPKQKPMRYGNIGRDVPFILGTGTGKSHSVTVNLQKAFALLKNHNPNSCSVCNKKNTTRRKSKKPALRSDVRSEREESPDIALGRVIDNLMDELEHLKMHYTNLVEEYQNIGPFDSKKKRSELTEEVKEVMDQMEMKGDQIATLYDIQQKTLRSSLLSKSRYGFKSTTQSKYNSQKPTRPIHETKAENLHLLRGTQRVQKTLNDL